MTFLDVPFREKDQAKQLGARWDAASRKWYVPTEMSAELELFQKWLPATVSESGLESHSASQLDVFSTPQNQPRNDNSIELSSLLRNIQTALRQSFPGAVWVKAEIANLNTRRGHVYLELTESNEQGKVVANCRAMIWQRQATALLQRFEHETGSPLAIGQKVLLLAEVSFHEQYGFSITIQDIDSSYTLGALEQKLNALRKQLIQEGLYQQNKRFVLPSDFFRVAVIAPPDAAGLGDFKADADRLQKHKLCDFHYFYSAFQGELVADEMEAAFQAVHALHQSNPFDVLVVIRGGGAKLDLHMLNLYSLAKLLCEATLPILTGIGHERDSTILDEVANRHFDTPSKVIGYIRHEIVQQAQRALANWKKIEHASLLSVKQLEQSLTRLNQVVQQSSHSLLFRWKQQLDPLNAEIRRLSERQLQLKMHHLNDLTNAIERQLINQVSLKHMALESLQQVVHEGTNRAVVQQKQRIQQWMTFILSSGPKTQLNRGFNIAKNPLNHKPITTAKEAVKVENIQLEFVDGCVSARIETEKGVSK